ncbi:hypothetical protein MACJ_002800 [Theileria orientalis]|uniref:Elongation factor Ts, mitochondrial n=1 Tax=Theileria orientalis TaxID=68886 RepID=A0A976M870_THEOR|nr:hypothetical protein MACJ_002800 [Theileria orientalis]
MAKKIKLLRLNTGKGAQDCFKALNEAKGDVRLASQILMNSLYDNKSSNEGSESELVLMLQGTIAVSCSPKLCSIVDVRCDSDFVANNKLFTNLAKSFANAAMEWKEESQGAEKTLEQLKSEILSKKCLRCCKTLAETGAMVRSSLREAISVARIGFIESDPDAFFVFYVHSSLDPKNSRTYSGSAASILSLGLDESNLDFYNYFEEKIEQSEENCCMTASGCVYSGLKNINLNDESELDSVKKFLRDLAIHVVAEKPKDIDIERYDKDGLEESKKELETLLSSGKPKEIAEKIVKGKLKKKYGESILMEQAWTFGDNKTVSQVIEETSKKLGTNIKLKKFITYSITDDLISYKHPKDCSFYNTNIKF